MTAPMTPVSESLAAQLRAPTLVVCGGPSGYRLAFAGGARFEVIADGLTYEQADKLYQEAKP